MSEKKHIIWSNIDLDLDDWYDDLHEEYPALGEEGLDVSSSGEHYGSSILTPIGMIEHDGSDLSPNQAELLREIVPYQYWYTPYIERDHHVDFDDLPPEVEEVLSYATVAVSILPPHKPLPTVVSQLTLLSRRPVTKHKSKYIPI